MKLKSPMEDLRLIQELDWIAWQIQRIALDDDAVKFLNLKGKRFIPTEMMDMLMKALYGNSKLEKLNLEDTNMRSEACQELAYWWLRSGRSITAI